MPRVARIVGINYPHHIIQRGNNRQIVFFDDKDRQFYLELLKRYSSDCYCKIHAYCLMNNHIHLLGVPLNKNSLSKAMQKVSLSFTQHINKKYKRTGRLWECRYHSALIDKETYLWAVCRYIERNPVRAKIVKLPNQYKWSSARVNTGEESNGFIEPIWRTYVEMEEYSEFLNIPDNKEEAEKIRRHTYSGKPIGDKKFHSLLEKSLKVTINTRPRGRPIKVNK